MSKPSVLAVVCMALMLCAASVDAAQWPIANPNFTSGPPNEYATYAMVTPNGYHTGMDILGPANPCSYNTQVVAGAAGTVAMVQPIQQCLTPPVGSCPGFGCPDQGLGNSVTVLGNDGVYYTYGHLDSIDANLQLGQAVDVSTPIGIMGNSSYGVPRHGYCPGVPACGGGQDFIPHLHFENKTSVFIGTGYYPNAPDFAGYQDAAREIYSIAPITPMVIRVLTSPLWVQGVPSSQFSPSAVVNVGDRFVAYEQAGSWLHVYVPAVRLLPPELWIPATLTGCTAAGCCPNGQCVASEPLSPLIVRVVSPPADGGVTARDQPSMSGTRTARLWNGQMFVVLARQLPQVGDTCTGEWFRLQTPQPYGNPVPAVWACSRIKDKVFLEVREPCDANGQCITPGICQSGPGTCTGTGCEYPTTAGAACDDGDLCTSNDTCDATTLCAGTQFCVPTSTPTPTPTVTSTRTPTRTPTPIGQVCTTFATGVCCDSADGTNCKAPAVVCTSNSTCAAQSPYTICAGASSDDGSAVSTQDPAYGNLVFSSCSMNTTVTGVARNFAGSNYAIFDGLLQWDTSRLPDDAIPISAMLTETVTVASTADNRNYVGEWFAWGTCDASDWTATAASSAFSTPISTIAGGNVDNSFPLSGLAGNINTTGRTLLRLHISGGVPTGLNRVNAAMYEHATLPGPRLQVCYVQPTPTVAPPTATATSTAPPTSTSTATVTEVPTATLTSTPVTADTPTATVPTSTTSTPTPTATDVPTPTATNTAVNTATPPLTATATQTATATVQPTSTNTATTTPSATQAPTASSTPTRTPSTTPTSVPTATATAPPSSTQTAPPTATRTRTPTPTATVGQVCTTFATGVCCDSADGANCKAPAVVCTSNSTCAGQSLYTICAGASGDDGSAVSTQDPVYGNVVSGGCSTGTTVTGVARNLGGGNYAVFDGLLQWDTSRLPDDAIPISATLIETVTLASTADNRSYTGEWFNWGTCDASDWTATAVSTAFSTPISAIAGGNVDNSFPLSGLAGNINTTGRTFLRLHISGGVPTGLNRVNAAMYEHATLPGPRLQVCYVQPTPTVAPPSATATSTVPPSATATVSPTSTSTATVTEVPTPLPTSTPVNTDTPTLPATIPPSATATAPPTSTSTATATDVPTASPTNTPVNTDTPTPPATVPPSATATAPPTNTSTATATDVATVAPTSTPVDTDTPTPAATVPPSATVTPTSSDTPTATVTDVPPATATQTAVNTDTPTLPATATPSATATVPPTSTDTPTATSTATQVPTASRTATPTATPTSSSSPTVTKTPTATTTRTPTPTPTVGQVCTTFATGMCCDSAGGTNCKAPVVACASNSACAGQAPYTICAGASADDVGVSSTAPASYGSLAFNQCFPSVLNVGVARNFSGGTYVVNNGLLQWDTSALPDNALLTSATLTLWVSVVSDTDGRSFQGEWFNWGATCDAADWSVTAASTAFSTPDSGLATNTDDSFALAGLAGNIDVTGRTYLRLHISGGQPTGLNRVIFATYDNTTLPGPRLRVCYVVPTPTPTLTPP